VPPLSAGPPLWGDPPRCSGWEAAVQAGPCDHPFDDYGHL